MVLMPDLYEKKGSMDDEYPMQVFISARPQASSLFGSHWHEHLEIHCVTEGTAELYCNQVCHTAEPGDIVIANSNELHRGYCKTPYSSYVLIVDLKKCSPELAAQNYVFRSMIRGDARVQFLMAQILEETEKQQIGFKQKCKSLVLELLVHLCRAHLDQVLSGQDARKRRQDLERISAVTNYIEMHYDEAISISQLAEKLYLSEGRFCHLFREIMGCAPVQYLNDFRLQKAWDLLSSDRFTVTQVAALVGFRDYNHFGRLFKKRYGCTPYQVKSGTMKENSKIV